MGYLRPANKKNNNMCLRENGKLLNTAYFLKKPGKVESWVRKKMKPMTDISQGSQISNLLCTKGNT